MLFGYSVGLTVKPAVSHPERCVRLPFHDNRIVYILIDIIALLKKLINNYLCEASLDKSLVLGVFLPLDKSICGESIQRRQLAILDTGV